MSRKTITRTKIPGLQADAKTQALFGADFNAVLLPYLFEISGNFPVNIIGGDWKLFELSNGAIYLIPDYDRASDAQHDTDYDDLLEAAGLALSIHTFRQFSKTKLGNLAQQCKHQYRLLRAYIKQHPHSGMILEALS